MRAYIMLNTLIDTCAGAMLKQLSGLPQLGPSGQFASEVHSFVWRMPGGLRGKRRMLTGAAAAAERRRRLGSGDGPVAPPQRAEEGIRHLRTRHQQTLQASWKAG